MKRSEMIEQMINFVNSTPEEASEYHKMDMLLSRIERLGIEPPHAVNPKPTFNCYCSMRQNCWECGHGNEWESED